MLTLYRMTKKYNKNKDKEIVDNGNIIFKLQHSRKLIKENKILRK